MLQQTTVKAVGPYFEKFLARWPTVEALGASSLDEVLSMWAGLGYYARARNLHACAVTVPREHGGAFPDTEDGLRALPGIGPYTAAAIAAIAFDRTTMPVDGNIERVVSRLFAVEEALPKAKPRIQRLAPTLRRTREPAMRAGADGSRRHDLHAEKAGLRAVSAERRLRRARSRRSGDVSAQGAEEDRRRCGAARRSSSRAAASCCVRTRPKRDCSAA